MPLSFP